MHLVLKPKSVSRFMRSGFGRVARVVSQVDREHERNIGHETGVAIDVGQAPVTSAGPSAGAANRDQLRYAID